MKQNDGLYKNTYRSQTLRLKSWNYGWNASYFLTICTKNRSNWFGTIINEKMQLNEIGKVAQLCWREISLHFPFVYLDEFVIMPNHIHGILTFDKMNDATVETQDFASLQKGRSVSNQFGSQSKNLASVIRGFKTGVTIQSRLIDENFSWQSRFYEHIIGSDRDLQRIRDYILANPSNWSTDENNRPGS